MNKLIYIIIVFIVILLGYSVISEMNKQNNKKHKRIECQNKTITFEKILEKKLIINAIQALKNKNYTITSHIEYSKYMNSKLINILTIEQANTYLKEIINSYQKNMKLDTKELSINYYVYENDKKDKGKKGKKSKLYAGYLLFEFKIENKLIYKIQSDYMKLDASDVRERMACIIKSFITIKGK